jgi:hypothetical protein
VAALAPVLIGDAEELALVHIRVAGGASGVGELEPGFRAARFVTF